MSLNKYDLNAFDIGVMSKINVTLYEDPRYYGSIYEDTKGILVVRDDEIIGTIKVISDSIYSVSGPYDTKQYISLHAAVGRVIENIRGLPAENVAQNLAV